MNKTFLITSGAGFIIRELLNNSSRKVINVDKLAYTIFTDALKLGANLAIFPEQVTAITARNYPTPALRDPQLSAQDADALSSAQSPTF